MSVIAKEAAATGGKYLTFKLGREEYGLEILKVREIIGYMEVTPVPRTPPYVKGVINLRGQVIPVVDLRAKFRMPAVPQTQTTCVIVVDSQQEERRLCMGIVVDSVCEVVNIPGTSIQDPPTSAESAAEQYVRGIGQIGTSIKILLDIDRVLSTNDVESLSAAQTTPAVN